MGALLAYLASHWVLATSTTLAVIGLGGAAYVFKNLKFALAAIALAVAGFMYQGAVMSGINLQIAKDTAAQAEILNSRLDTLNTLALKNAMQAKVDADKIEELERTASETPTNAGACFDVDTARRVSNIGKQPAKSVTPGARRYPNLFSKGSR